MERLKCSCGKGYASEDWRKPYYGKCRPCYLSSMTRRQRKDFEHTEYKQNRVLSDEERFGIFI